MFMYMLMRKWEQHKTNKWVRSSCVSAYAYAYVAGVPTCYAYVMLMRQSEPTLTLILLNYKFVHCKKKK